MAEEAAVLVDAGLPLQHQEHTHHTQDEEQTQSLDSSQAHQVRDDSPLIGQVTVESLPSAMTLASPAEHVMQKLLPSPSGPVTAELSTSRSSPSAPANDPIALSPAKSHDEAQSDAVKVASTTSPPALAATTAIVTDSQPQATEEEAAPVAASTPPVDSAPTPERPDPTQVVADVAADQETTEQGPPVIEMPSASETAAADDSEIKPASPSQQQPVFSITPPPSSPTPPTTVVADGSAAQAANMSTSPPDAPQSISIPEVSNVVGDEADATNDVQEAPSSIEAPSKSDQAEQEVVQTELQPQQEAVVVSTVSPPLPAVITSQTTDEQPKSSIEELPKAVDAIDNRTASPQPEDKAIDAIDGRIVSPQPENKAANAIDGRTASPQTEDKAASITTTVVASETDPPQALASTMSPDTKMSVVNATTTSLDTKSQDVADATVVADVVASEQQPAPASKGSSPKEGTLLAAELQTSVGQVEQAQEPTTTTPPQTVQSASVIPPLPSTPSTTAAAESQQTATTQVPVTSTSSSSTSSPQVDTLVAKQIALLLKINKELIRLCVDLQTKELTGDPIYKTSAMRLQANLGFLASLTEASSGNSSAVLNDEPFPVTMHAADSLLPKLYAHLRSLNAPPASPTAVGKKRRRGTTENDASPVRAAPNRAGSLSGGEKPGTTASATPASKAKAANSRRKSSVASAASAAAASSPMVANYGAPGAMTGSTTMTSAATYAPTHPGVSGPSVPFTNAAPSPAPSMSNGHAANVPPRTAASPASNAAASAGSPSQQPNGVRPGGPTPQQLQGLIQAFGQNAVTNLNALQAHYRGGQQQALVGYMEANVANFRNLPLQMQLQHMATVQNAALQRQRQASVGSASSPNASGAVQTPSQAQQARPTPPSRRTSAAPSPGGASAAAEHMRRSTQSPMAAPATPFQNAANQQQQQHQNVAQPNTPMNMSMPFAAGMASPASASTVASPGMFQPHQQQQQQQQQQHYQNMMHQHAQQQQPQQHMGNPYGYPTQQQNQQMPQLSPAQAQQLMTSLPASLSGLPAHLQQQLLQQLLQQQQQQQQQQLTSQPMAPPGMSGNVGVGGMNPMMAAMLQQQQQQQQQQQAGSPSSMFRGVGLGAAGGQGATGPSSSGMPNLGNMWAAMQQQQQQQNPSSSSS